MDKNTSSHPKKSKPHNARPYDRPNQSIFGKVASKVKGLLNPSWIFNVPQWIRNTTEEQDDAADLVEEEVEEPTPHFSEAKRRRLTMENSSIRQQSWLQPPSQNSYTNIVTRNPTPSCSTITHSTPLLENKDPLVGLNGASTTGDDHSENSEGSASTSGCSSLVSSHKDRNSHTSTGFKLSLTELKNLREGLREKTVFQTPSNSSTLQKKNFSQSPNCNKKSLWSTDSTTTTPKSLQRPLSIYSTKPNFNLSVFPGPSQLTSQEAEKRIASPFYKGKTTFGGASSVRRMPTTVAPYQVEKSLRNQIMVKKANIPDDLDCMSSAAKRILHTLEKMSTPISDAKKIPNTNKSPVDLSLYLTPPKHRQNSHLNPTHAIKGPPIANINAITKLTTMKNYSQKRSRNSSMEIPFSTPSQKDIQEKLKNLIPDTYENTDRTIDGGGKMRRKLNQHHFSRDNVNSEAVNELPLPVPSVPLTISKLPTINFGLTSTPNIETSTIKEKSNNLIEKPFTFSSPIEHAIPVTSVSTLQSISNYTFKFSSPLSVATEENSSSNSSLEIKTKVPENNKSNELYNGSVNNYLKMLREEENTPRRTEAESTEKSPRVFDDVIKSKKVEVKTSEANENEAKISFGNSNVKTSNASLSVNNNKLVSFNEPGSWECSTCLVRNTADKDTCVACETKKSTAQISNKSENKFNKEKQSTIGFSFGDKFKPEPGTWECSSCMVRNKAAATKCIACETPHSNAKLQEKAKPLLEKEKSTEVSIEKPSNSTTWVCDTCLVKNSTDKVKCVACETLKPKKENTFDNLNSGFKFTSPMQNSPITFKFGSYVCTCIPSTTTSSFTFGIPSNTSLKTTVSSSSFNNDISFKSSDKEKANQPSPLPGFNSLKQESLVSNSSTLTSGFKFNTSAFSPLSSGATFGAKKAETSASFSSGDDNKLTAVHEPGSWECSSCLLRNKASAEKCVACETKKSNTSSEKKTNITNNEKPSNQNLGEKQEQEKNQSSVFLANTKTTDTNFTPPDSSKSIISSKENVKNSSENEKIKESTESSTEATSKLETWNCSTCLIKNSMDKDKCVACEASRPDKENTSDAKISSGGFKFTSPIQNSTGFKFGSLVTTSQATVSTSTFTFGVPSNTTAKTFFATTSANTGFTFKSPNENKSQFSSNQIGFGVFKQDPAVSSSATTTTPAFKFESGNTSSTTAPFVFGATKTEAQNKPFAFSSNFDDKTKSGQGITESSTFSFGKKTSDPKPISNQQIPLLTTNQEKKIALEPPKIKDSTSEMSTDKVTISQNQEIKLPTTVTTNASLAFKALPTTTSASNTPGFSFFSTSSNENVNNPSLFTFGSSSTASQIPKPGGFTFNQGKNNEITSNNLGFNMFKQEPVVPSTSTTTAPVFKFGSTGSSQTGGTGGFVFGAHKTESQPPPFAFGSNPVSVASPLTFQGFPRSQPAAAAPAPSFPFNSQTSNNMGGPSPFATPFVFGSKSNDPPNQMTNQNASKNPLLLCSTLPQQQTMLGSTPAPAFGVTADKSNIGGFTFGNPTTQPQSSVFRFGNQTQVDKKPAAPSGFNFTPNTFQPNFNMNTPPSFNFGAQSTSAGPFLFAASSSEGSSQHSSSQPRKYRKAVRRSIRKQEGQ